MLHGLTLALSLACTDEPTPPTESQPVQGKDTGEGCVALCELEVGTDYECDGDTGAERWLEVSVQDQTVTVIDHDWGGGCCPEFTARAVLAPEAGTLELVYVLDNDFCDCICSLTLYSQIAEVPPGSWTLIVDGQEQLVTVP